MDPICHPWSDQFCPALLSRALSLETVVVIGCPAVPEFVRIDDSSAETALPVTRRIAQISNRYVSSPKTRNCRTSTPQTVVRIDPKPVPPCPEIVEQGTERRTDRVTNPSETAFGIPPDRRRITQNRGFRGNGGFTPSGESEQDKTPHSRGGLSSPRDTGTATPCGIFA